MYAIHPRNMIKNAVCVKELIGKYEISISFDDSCGKMENCSRGDIRVFDNLENEDITNKIFGDNWYVVQATIENLIIAYNWVKSNS